ncbi:MAG: hypothetical protein NTV92_08695, partial [Candidatus Bipolaricaulota bacterium]|nr:hypothetical protein [Candidatus Bipolaricaulota bacterium]
MSPCRGDLQRALRGNLPSHLAKLVLNGHSRAARRLCRRHRGGTRSGAAQDVDGLEKRPNGEHREVGDEGALSRIVDGNQDAVESAAAGLERQRQHPVNALDPAIQCELPGNEPARNGHGYL